MNAPLRKAPTTVTRLTASLPAAIATLAIDGPQALVCAGEVVCLRTAELQMGRIYYGELQLGDWLQLSSNENSAPGGSEQVVVCRTSDQRVEVSCHGGVAVCEAIIDRFLGAGCQPGLADDFDDEVRTLLQREAESDMLRARTDRSAAVLLDQYNGVLDAAVERILRELNGSTLGLRANARATERERERTIVEAKAMLNQLLSTAALGLHLADGFRIVLVGPPNVGKSSLTNALIGADKAIVHEAAGTTRDWIEIQTALEGWPISITDTAGFRETRDDIERQGIEHARRQLRLADLAVLLVDATLGWTDTHEHLVATAVEAAIVAVNKSDLVNDRPELPASQLAGLQCIDISCRTNFGLDSLLQTIAQRLVPSVPSVGQAVLFRQWQVDTTREALECLLAGDAQAASERLRQLVPSWIRPNKTP